MPPHFVKDATPFINALFNISQKEILLWAATAQNAGGVVLVLHLCFLVHSLRVTSPVQDRS